MSMMSYLEAIESVLNREMEERLELIVFRPGARRALAETERDVALPRMGKAEFSVALGASLAGMHSVLDLRQENDCANLLLDALCELPAGVMPEMTVITGAEDADALAELPGVLTLYPRTPRQAAGFTRAALRSSRMTILIVDSILCEMEDDVPEDDDFIMLPLEAEMPEEPAEDTEENEADDGCADAEKPDEAAEDSEEADSGAEEEQPSQSEMMDESAPSAEEEPAQNPQAANAEERSVCAGDMPEAFVKQGSQAVCDAEMSAENGENAAENHEKPDSCEEHAVRMRFCATHMTVCDLTKLRALAGELEMPEPMLIEKCVAHACGGRMRPEWRYDAEATSGEAAFLPSESEHISLWLGWDVLTVSYDAAAVEYAEAAGLMRAVRRVLEKPALLIYDKESGCR